MPVLFLIIFRRSGAYGSNLYNQVGAFSPITADMVGALADETVSITNGGTGATTAAVAAYDAEGAKHDCIIQAYDANGSPHRIMV